MALTLGIDVACRAAHQATLAVDGKTVRGARHHDDKAPHLVAALV